MEAEIILDCDRVSHWFGPKKVLCDVCLKILQGQIVAVVGPSGCGKSTLLRAIVGTHPARQGEIHTFSRSRPDVAEVVRRPGRDRGIVYQRYSLFPFLTARQNVALGLMLDQTGISGRAFTFWKWWPLRRRHLQEAAALLERIGLGDAIHLYPRQMSGGMQQRVAVAQALIMKPRILLLDEPFGALDEAMREELQRLLLRLYQENRDATQRGDDPPHTILIVTHELNEAIFVGDRVVGLSQYWDWQEAGHHASPGATIVYDAAAPVFEPHDEKDYMQFARQRREIRQAVFDPAVLQPPEQYRRFWKQVDSHDSDGPELGARTDRAADA